MFDCLFNSSTWDMTVTVAVLLLAVDKFTRCLYVRVGMVGVAGGGRGLVLGRRGRV